MIGRGSPATWNREDLCFLDWKSVCWASVSSARVATWNFREPSTFWRSTFELSVANCFFLETIVRYLFADWSCPLICCTSGSGWNIKLSSFSIRCTVFKLPSWAFQVFWKQYGSMCMVHSIVQAASDNSFHCRMFSDVWVNQIFNWEKKMTKWHYTGSFV